MKLKPGHIDLIFILPTLAAISMMSDQSDFARTTIELSGWAQVIILVPATLLIAYLANIGAKIDRRCSEDYIMQLMAYAGLIAVITTIMVNMLWGLAALILELPDLTAENMAGVTAISWCIRYYWYRFPGIAAGKTGCKSCTRNATGRTRNWP